MCGVVVRENFATHWAEPDSVDYMRQLCGMMILLIEFVTFTPLAAANRRPGFVLPAKLEKFRGKRHVIQETAV